MRAVVYHGPGRKAWEEAPAPEITDDGDVIVRVDTATICGTDLHILKGDVPAVHQGRILGHEAVGTVEEAGEGVHTLTPGDRVLVSCISACGRAGSAARDGTGSAWAAEAGCSGTRSTAPRPSTSACRSPTCRPRRQAGGGQALRRRRDREQLTRGSASCHQGPDRAPGRRRVHRG